MKKTRGEQTVPGEGFSSVIWTTCSASHPSLFSGIIYWWFLHCWASSAFSSPLDISYQHLYLQSLQHLKIVAHSQKSKTVFPHPIFLQTPTAPVLSWDSEPVFQKGFSTIHLNVLTSHSPQPPLSWPPCPQPPETTLTKDRFSVPITLPLSGTWHFTTPCSLSALSFAPSDPT